MKKFILMLTLVIMISLLVTYQKAIYNQVSFLWNFSFSKVERPIVPYKVSEINLTSIPNTKPRVISAREMLEAQNNSHSKSSPLIVAFLPGDFSNLSFNLKMRLLTKATSLAITNHAIAIIDCSIADGLRSTKMGKFSAISLKEAKIPRVVIWDGAHHLLGLALQPELVITPCVDNTQWGKVIAHGYIKDSVPLKLLIKLIADSRLPIIIIPTQRFSTITKTPHSLAALWPKLIKNIKDIDSSHYQGVTAKEQIASITSVQFHQKAGVIVAILIGDVFLIRGKSVESLKSVQDIVLTHKCYISLPANEFIEHQLIIKSFIPNGVIISQTLNSLDLLKQELYFKCLGYQLLNKDNK